MITLTNSDLVTTDELADLLKVSPLTVRDWRKRRTGPRAIKVGHAVRYRRDDVETWIAQTNGITL